MAGTIGVGLLGCGFIGQFHSHAFRAVRSVVRPPSLLPELVSAADLDDAVLADTQDRFKWQETTKDWRDQVSDERVELFCNAGPNILHVEPSLAAMEAGKHVFCEKPLAPSADEAQRMWRAAEAAGVVHMCAFVKRFVPALRLAREMVAGGELGEIHHYRAEFLMDTAIDTEQAMSWRFDRRQGFGALGDLGAHHIDLARYIVGEVREVAGLLKTAVTERHGAAIGVDDAFTAVATLENGALATFVASRIAGGHGVTSRIGVDGTKGSLVWEMERLNELQVAGPDRGYRTLQVVRHDHPFGDFWWSGGIQGQHSISWIDCFVHQAYHMLEAVAGDVAVAPLAASFEDGYRVAKICDTIADAAASGQRLAVAFA